MEHPVRDPAPPSSRLEIVVDHRERASGLVDALEARWPLVGVGTLDTGDVCVGARIRVERKTVHDLVVSLGDGRLFRQLHALCGAVDRPLLVIEGRDSWAVAGLRVASLRGLLLSVAVGYRIPMLRTLDVEETATWIAFAATQESRRLARSVRPRRVGPTAVLAAIPGVGDHRARRLLGDLGSVDEVFGASEARLQTVEGIGAETARRIRTIGEAGLRDPRALAPDPGES
ncbi:MAG: ERCC4 domain-containing protein [Planctomycetota bacterium]